MPPPKSGAAELINKLKVGQVVDPKNKEEIKRKIYHFYSRWQSNKLSVPKINLSPYERKKLTGDLSSFLDELSKPKKIKLCLIGNILSPQNQSLIDFFKKKNYEIHFISTQPGKISGIKSYYLGKGNFTLWYFLKSTWAVRRLARKINPDIIHGEDLVFGGIWAYLSGIRPLVVTPWGSDVMNYQKFIKFERYLIKKTLENADLVTISSSALKDKVYQITKPQRIETVHFGIDLQLFKKDEAAGNLREKLNLAKSQIIYCPRSIAPIYNTDILIDAIAKIARKNLKLLLTVQNADEPYLVEIEKKIIKLNLVDHVQFLPSLNFREIPKLYNLADVIVTLTSSDGCSVSFLEAMTLEKKIVATDLPYLKDWYNGDNLWIVPVRDVLSTAKTLNLALKFPLKEWRPIGKHNRQLIAEQAEINANFEKLDSLYRSLQ